MQAIFVAFVCGVCSLQQMANLPGTTSLGTIASLAMVLLVHVGYRKSTLAGRRLARFAANGVLLLAAASLGFAYAAWRAEVRLADALFPGLEGRDVWVTGVVAGLPVRGERGVRFDFDVESSSEAVPRMLRLSIYEREGDDLVVRPVRAGERWTWTVRLRRPHGNANPHGFDYEAYLLERGIRATGYVRPGQARLLDPAAEGAFYALERMRAHVCDRFQAVLGEQPGNDRFSGVMTALVIGDQSGIPLDQWLSFSRTGITHLVSISGLHVTMLAGLAYGLAALVWKILARTGGNVSQALLHVPLPVAGTVAGILAAGAYCLIAGFAIPAQRTLYMLAVVGLAQLSRRNIGFMPALTLALWVVVLIDPWAVLSAGFWLSFGAVTVLLFVGDSDRTPRRQATSPGLRLRTSVVSWVKGQSALSLAMVPVLLALFGQVSLISPLTNALAIPVVSFFVTPLALLAAATATDLPLFAAHHGFAAMMVALDGMAAWPLAVWQRPVPPAVLVAIALAGVALMLAPVRWPVRVLGLMALAPLMLWQAPRPALGDIVVRVLDVGQGLAIHGQTAHHDLLFDAGPGYSSETDAGSRIIAPYLRALGVGALEHLVVSHRDSDHAGGAVSVARAVPVGKVLHSLPESSGVLSALQNHADTLPCAQGMSYEWDGVRFSYLHPPSGSRGDHSGRRQNARSCVLQIESGGRRILLPSDIEAPQEQDLLAHGQQTPGSLRSEVLIAPHHGSQSSSTPQFLAAVAPELVIFPVGYRNIYGHPRPEILERYMRMGAQIARTDTDGAVTVRVRAGRVSVELERERQRRYWHGR